MKKAILICLGLVAAATAGLYALGKIRKTNEQKVDLTPGDKKDKEPSQVQQPDHQPEPA